MVAELFVLLAVLILVGLLLNKKAMNTFRVVLSAMLGKSAAKAIEMDPIAVYKDKVDKCSEELKSALDLLEEHSALIKRLKRKLETDQNEYKTVESWVKKFIDADDTSKAQEYAGSLVKLEESLANTKNRLDASEKMYKAQAEKIKTLKELIIGYKQKATQLSSDLQTSKAEAKISELTSKFDPNSLSFDDLKEMEDIIQGQIDKNESKASVAQDLYTTNPKTEIEKEQKEARAKELIDKLSNKK